MINVNFHQLKKGAVGMRSCYVTSVLRNDEGTYFAKMHTQLEKALGFEPGSEVYFSWIERKITIGGKTESRPELIVTSISPDAWNDLYDLEFYLGDEPGSLASVADILGKNGINILIAQSRTTMRGKKAEWTMSADFSGFSEDPEELKDILIKEIEKNPDKSKKEYLENRILRINNRREPGDYVQIRRSGFYEELKELKGQKRKIPFHDRSTVIRPRKIKDEEVDTLEIPQSVMQMLSEVFHTAPQNIDAVVMIADTEKTILSLWFPHHTEKIAKIFLEIDYKPGSLAEIATFLSKKGVDLLETDLNILVLGDRCVWKVVANINGKEESPCEYSDCRSIKELKKRLVADMKKDRIEAFRGIYYSSEVGVWTRKPIWNLPHDKEIVIERGQRGEAEQFLQKCFNSFGSEVKAILPYMDKTTLDYLDQIPKCCGIRVITSIVKDRKKCLEEADDLAKNRPFLEILELALKTEDDHYSPLEHTRWICSKNLFVILETDLKRSSLGSRDYSIEVKETGKCGGRIEKFEKRWDQNAADLEKEVGMTVIRKFFYRSGVRQ
ncbi:MAG: ACT domain-containing protein [Theionarchaea archaeon]|nr:ACT domain-containing protein [Theionarchaea archaeon]